MTMPARFVRDLSETYERLHTAKEEAFWTAHMGLADDADDARKELDAKEIELSRFLRDPARLEQVREELQRAETEGAAGEVVTALRGWVRTLQAHVVEGAEAQALADEIVALEGDLARARGKLKLGYRLPGQELVEASSVKLAVMVSNDKDEARRQAAWEGLKRIEPFVLENGFLDLVRKRNRLGRLLGGEDYYDWKTKRTEGMAKREIFALLDRLEQQTRDAARRSLEELKRAKGAGAARPFNVRYFMTGDVSNEMDPYFPFAGALKRWGRSFAALGIDYRGADLVLDLLDRKGKFENGFCHGPVPAWRRDGVFRPARVQFTANAIPGLTGSGKRALATLFHEGGHAAHFANIDMPAPCFSQEFAPTSVAFAETQSMFLDSLLSDADWLTRYARTGGGDPATRAGTAASPVAGTAASTTASSAASPAASPAPSAAAPAGAPIPFALIEKAIRAEQASSAWALRAMFTVCYCERAIYEIPDDELTETRILDEIRGWERKLLFLDDASPRPALSVPHLLSGEASAYYHGYTLALMAVEQTRRYFLDRDGYLTDNPKIGPDLRRAYWEPGNSKRFPDFIFDLTGQEVSPDALAARVSRTPDAAVEEARRAVDRLRDVAPHTAPIDLNATLRIVHGRDEITSTAGGFDAAATAFARWIESLA